MHLSTSIDSLDFNQDGYDDILVGSPGTILNTGSAFLIYGSSSPDPSLLSISIDGSNGIQFFGNFSELTGTSVAAAGDVNNDGYPDFLIGAPSPLPGKVFLIFGTSNPNTTFPHPFDLSDINGTNGITFIGDTNDGIGNSISSAGDFNNDGYEDFLLASPIAGSKSVYLIFGADSSSFVHPFDLSLINGSNGIKFPENPSSPFPSYIDLHGALGMDINFDGFDDFIIGIPFNPGEVNIIYGSNTYSSPFPLVSLNETTGVRIRADGIVNGFGSSVTFLKDVNTDGNIDILIGARYSSTVHGSFTGLSFLVWGSPNLPFNLDISDITGLGVKIGGLSNNDEFGASVSSAGDVNNDGYTDFIIGSPIADPTGYTNGGLFTLFFGAPTASWPTYIDLYDDIFITSSQIGYIFIGPGTSSSVGSSLAAAGDFNNDGIDDFLVGGDDGDGHLYLYLGSDTQGSWRNLSSNALTPCLPGFIYPWYGFTTDECFPCDAGSYADELASTECTRCPASTWQNLTGQPECYQCPLGYYGTTIESTTEAGSCFLCPKGTYGPKPQLQKCIACPPTQSVCPTKGMIFPLPAPGYQNIPGSETEFIQCYPLSACPGLKSSVCATGYKEPTTLCTVCDSNYKRLNNRCVPCSEFDPTFLIVYFVIIILGLNFLHLFLKENKNTDPIFSFISLIQSCAIFAFLKVPGTSHLFKSIFDIFSIFTLVDIRPTLCDSLFTTSFLIQLFVPLVSVVVVVLLLFIWHQGRGSFGLSRFKTQVSTMVFFICYIFYPMTSYTALSTFSCSRFNSSSPNLVDSNASITCFSSEWWSVAWLSIIFTIFYIIGFPLAILVMSLKHFEKFQIFSNATTFKPQYSYWESLLLIRKFLSILFIISTPSTYQSSLGLIFFLHVVSLGLNESLKPFASKYLNHHDSLNSFTVVLLAIFTLLVSSFDPGYPILLVIIISIIISFTLCYKMYTEPKQASPFLSNDDGI